ncbi:MAG: FMN-binding protein [Eubacteriales bacterium]
MKKALKTVLFVILGIIALGLVLAGFGTLGLKEATALEIAAIDLSQVPDGKYEGSYQNGRWSNDVEVTVKDSSIEDIRIIKSGNSSQIAVLEEISNAVIEQQKVNIDAVSGATATTNSLLKAIENAFE